MSSSPECHSLPQGFEFDSYRIEQLLSQGGFSFVYLAHDAAGTPVVIKEYLPAHLCTGLPVLPSRRYRRKVWAVSIAACAPFWKRRDCWPGSGTPTSLPY